VTARRDSRWAARALALAIALACTAAPGCGDARTPPVVVDTAGVLDAAQQERIAQHHALLLRDHDIDYRVEVTAGVGSLADHARRRFRELGVGGRSQGGRGLLLVLDPAADRVRLEVGQRLEGVYTDAFVAYLQERQMVPFFRAGRVADGILATTERVVTRAQRAREGATFAAPGAAESAGGGAERPAALGAGGDGRFRSGPDVAAQDTPRATVAAYIEAMRRRNGRAALDLYTAETRAMLAGRVVTAAQMDAVTRDYRDCGTGTLRTAPDGTRAVIRYPPSARLCAPWLLVREEDRWRLDLASAGRIFRFGAGNAWHLAPGAEHPYAWAFADWRFDAHGFPVADTR
jgi:uncharacterized protein